MLQRIRDNARNSMAILLLGLLILAFAVWGIDFQFGANQPIVEVNDEEVPNFQILNAYNQQLQRYQEFYPNGIPEVQQNELKQSVLEAFVRNELLTQHTKKQGYNLSDQMVMAEIKKTPGFQIDGKFDVDQFEFRATQAGLTADGLFGEFRKTMLMQQLAQSFNDTAFVTKDEIRQRGQLQREKRTIKNLIIDANKLIATLELDEGAAAQDYEQNKADYVTDEMVKLDYIELDPAKISANITVDSELLQSRYDAGLGANEFTSEATFSSRHILVAVNSERDEDEALAEITALRERIVAGEDFAELATEHSDDAGSKPQGGDLGWSSPDAFVGPFKDALLALNENEVSAPVKTRFGYHIIRLEGTRGGEVKTLDEVKEQLEAEIREDLGLSQLSELISTIDEVVYDVDDSLEAAAAEAGVEVQQTNFFSRLSGSGLANNPEVRTIAFSEQVLDDKLNSSSIDIDDKYYYVRLNEHRPSRVMTFEEVRPRIEIQLKRKKAGELAKVRGEELLERLKGGAEINAIATELELPEVESKTIERSDRSLPPVAVSAIFSAPKPAPESAYYGGASTSNGNYIVFQLESVEAGEPLDATQISDFARATANMEFAAYLSQLREQADVVMRPDLMNR